MKQVKSMANWMITATTIYCEAVDDEVTLVVYRDGTSRCTGRKKSGKPDKEAAKLAKTRSKPPGKQTGCAEPECHRLIQYRDKSLAE